MATKDMYTPNTGNTCLFPAVRTATASGPQLPTSSSGGVDVGQYAEGALCFFSVGAFGDALPTTSSGATAASITPVLQESADAVTWSSVAAADIIGTIPPTLQSSSLGGGGGASKTYVVGYRGSKRFLQWQDLRVGTQSTGTPTFAYILRGYLRTAPQAYGS